MPGRPQPHRPVLSPEALEQARRIARQRSAPHRLVVRARLAVFIAAHPDASHEAVARRIGLDATNGLQVETPLGHRGMVPGRRSEVRKAAEFFPLRT
jgi:hypothetical protein